MKKITVVFEIDDVTSNQEAYDFVQALIGSGIMDLNDAPEDFEHPRGFLSSYEVTEVT